MNRFEQFTGKLAKLNLILVEYSRNGLEGTSVASSKTSHDIKSLDNLLIKKSQKNPTKRINPIRLGQRLLLLSKKRL